MVIDDQDPQAPHCSPQSAGSPRSPSRTQRMEGCQGAQDPRMPTRPSACSHTASPGFEPRSVNVSGACLLLPSRRGSPRIPRFTLPRPPTARRLGNLAASHVFAGVDVGAPEAGLASAPVMPPARSPCRQRPASTTPPTRSGRLLAAGGRPVHPRHLRRDRADSDGHNPRVRDQDERNCARRPPTHTRPPRPPTRSRRRSQRRERSRMCRRPVSSTPRAPERFTSSPPSPPLHSCPGGRLTSTGRSTSDAYARASTPGMIRHIARAAGREEEAEATNREGRSSSGRTSPRQGRARWVR